MRLLPVMTRRPASRSSPSRRWLRDRADPNAPTDLADALAQLSHVWKERSLDEHIYATFYRERAEGMVAQPLKLMPRDGNGGPQRPRHVDLPHGRVVFTPDYIERLAKGGEGVVQFRTGRLSKSEGEKPRYALLQAGEALDGLPPLQGVRVVSLSTGASLDATVKPPARARPLEQYDVAMRNIAAGHFPASPDERRCPSCAYYFICPTP